MWLHVNKYLNQIGTSSAEFEENVKCQIHHRTPKPNGWHLADDIFRCDWKCEIYSLKFLCSWGYIHHSSTELLPTLGPSPSRCSGLLWLNVLFASNWGWRHQEPFDLPYHEPALVIEWQRHTCSFLLDTKSLWHWGKWKSGPTNKRNLLPRDRPTGKCPQHRFQAIG